MLRRDEADIGAASFSITKERAEEAGYLIPFTFSDIQMWIKKPKSVDGSETYSKPFSPWLLVFSVGAIILTIVTMTLANALRSRFMDDYQGFDVKESFVTALHGTFCQGAPKEPGCISLKIIFETMFLLGFILCSAYSACLTSFLAVKKIQLPFTDLKGLFDTPYRIIGVKGIIFTWEYEV